MRITKILITLLACFSITQAISQSNVLDLRDIPLDTKLKGLEHQWQMVYGAFLDANEMRAIPDKFYINVPGGRWSGKDYQGIKLPATGYATYYLRVLVDQKLENLGLNAQVATSNSRLFVNGELLGETGEVGKSREEAEPLYLNKIYKLPPHDGVLDIVYHISNFHYRTGGLGRATIIGNYDLLKEGKARRIALSFFLIGSIFFMGLYHFGISLFRFRSKMALYFSLVCFLTVLRTLSVNEYLLNEYMNFPWWMSTRIELISFYLILAFTIKFIYHMFPAYVPAFFNKVPYYLAIGASIITVFAPLIYSSYLVPPMQILTIVTGFSMLYFIIKASLTGDKEVIVALVGFTLLFGITVSDIMFHQSHISGHIVFAGGIFLYLFSHVSIMAYRLNTTYQNNEDLSSALQLANVELEEKVKERTEQLDLQNEALLQNNADLRRIHEEKNGLIHVVAHDLKSPLNTNVGLIKLIKMGGNLSADQVNFLESLEKSNSQGINLINDLLTLYQLESQEYIDIAHLHLDVLINQLVNKHVGTASVKDIEIQAEVGNSQQIFYTDESLLVRILDNMISNAIKFSYPNSLIAIKATVTNGMLYVEVSDQGMGILEEEQSKIFKKFQRMSNKPTGNESSSGLGLSIVKELTEKLKGKISFVSKPGKGTTFILQIPDLKNEIFSGSDKHCTQQANI